MRVVLLAWMVLATAALALEARAGDAVSLTGDAKADYDLGHVLFARGDYAGALARFERAHALSPDPRLLWDMAACHRKLGHFARAIALVDEYLAATGSTLSDADHREADRARAALARHVAVVTIVTSPDGIRVAIDGEEIGTTPLGGPVLVDEGAHTVRYARQGFRTITRAERVTGGGEATWRTDLERLRIRLVTAGSGNRP
jgi:tetratricopeptide (TPR) repeat protein